MHDGKTAIMVKLEQVWGVRTPRFCTACGAATFACPCGDGVGAAWSELDGRGRRLVRLQTMRRAKAARRPSPVITAAS